VRWMQETRRCKPSTVSRHTSVLAGFYRTCVIDGVLEHSPAEFVRRPAAPAESPTLGLTHLQFEAMLTAARESSNPNDFALVAMLGLLGLRIFEATGTNVGDLGEEHGHRVLRVVGKGTRIVLVPLPPAVGRAVDRAVDGRDSGPILRNTRGARMDRHAATRRLRHLATAAGVGLPRMHPHPLRHTFVTTMLDAGVDLRDVQIAARHADPRTTMRYDRARKNLDRHPNYILAAYMASGIESSCGTHMRLLHKPHLAREEGQMGEVGSQLRPHLVVDLARKPFVQQPHIGPCRADDRALPPTHDHAPPGPYARSATFGPTTVVTCRALRPAPRPVRGAPRNLSRKGAPRCESPSGGSCGTPEHAYPC
jgi:integrase/recombinase XerD